MRFGCIGCRGVWGGFRGLLAEVVHEDVGEVAGSGEFFFGVFGVVEGVGVVLGERGDEAVGGVFDDFFDGGGGGGLGGELFGEVVGGKLQGVEEEAGAARVEGGVGDFAHDVADGELDRGAVLGHGEGEGFRVDRFGKAGGGAAGLVEVAEVLRAEAGGLAAAAFGVDVAALEAWDFGGFDGFGCGWHAVPLPGIYR
jgi:hypothetical protein